MAFFGQLLASTITIERDIMRIFSMILPLITLASPLYLNAQPVVTHFEWGRVEVTNDDATKHTYRDCILTPDSSKEWNWTSTGTRHHPGIQVADVEPFIKQVDVVVLSQGVDGVLEIMPETIAYLQRMKKEYTIARTPTAIQAYKDLVAAGKKVGALLHSTC